MAEEPTKLFATHADRYPQPDDADKARTALEKIVEQVPILGPATVHVLSQFLMPAYQRRQEEWFKSLADSFEAEERANAAFRASHAFENEAFTTAVIQATRIAVSTHQEEKREALRNALLNIALHRLPDEDQQQTFLRYIEELTEWHLRILLLFQSPVEHMAAKDPRLSPSYSGGAPVQVIESFYPELLEKKDFYRQIVSDLFTRGLLSTDAKGFHVTMTPQGMFAKRTTAFADAFLAFIARPL